MREIVDKEGDAYYIVLVTNTKYVMPFMRTYHHEAFTVSFTLLVD
jgi:hypothetical protein